jgi:hypothetical protein
VEVVMDADLLGEGRVPRHDGVCPIPLVTRDTIMLKKLRPALAAVLIAGLVISWGSSASAAVVERYSLDYSASGVADDFCGSGLQPSFTYDQTGSGAVKTRGDSLFWFHEKLTVVRTFTYNGMTVTDTQPNTVVKDHKIVDNGDGTLSITVLYAGGARLVGSDGKLLAKNDGQIRMLLTIDIEEEEVIGEELIFGSTGTNDDFCEAILAHWGV